MNNINPESSLPEEGQDVIFKAASGVNRYSVELAAKFTSGWFICGDEAFLPEEVSYWRVMGERDMSIVEPYRPELESWEDYKKREKRKLANEYYQKNRVKILQKKHEYWEKKKAAKTAGTV